jgi:hypothetical protein
MLASESITHRGQCRQTAYISDRGYWHAVWAMTAYGDRREGYNCRTQFHIREPATHAHLASKGYQAIQDTRSMTQVHGLHMGDRPRQLITLLIRLSASTHEVL